MERSWEELWGWEERAPVVQHRLLDFPSLNSETQTSEQALSGRRFVPNGHTVHQHTEYYPAEVFPSVVAEI